MTLVGLTLAAAAKAYAAELGFDAVAIGPATPIEHGTELARWLDAGYSGTMGYLEHTRAERADPGRLLPGARSVVVVALSYNPGPQHDAEEAARGWGGIARYARGADYHDVMRPRLEALARFIDASAGTGSRSRAAVDTSAVAERDVAARAGLGWIGKNTNLLSERLGSYFFLGVVLTTAAMPFDDRVADRCGTCRACLDACPTEAFPDAYVLDARRCISYLTIEHRGDVDEELGRHSGRWLFGCDLCQEVCPWNRKAAPRTEAAFAARGDAPAPTAVLALDPDGFRARFRGTAITRTKRGGLARNATIVLGNGRDRSAIPALEAALSDPDGVVRRAAARALACLR
jgi:epoxyqueuosine reductase